MSRPSAHFCRLRPTAQRRQCSAHSPTTLSNQLRLPSLRFPSTRSSCNDSARSYKSSRSRPGSARMRHSKALRLWGDRELEEMENTDLHFFKPDQTMEHGLEHGHHPCGGECSKLRSSSREDHRLCLSRYIRRSVTITGYQAALPAPIPPTTFVPHLQKPSYVLSVMDLTSLFLLRPRRACCHDREFILSGYFASARGSFKDQVFFLSSCFPSWLNGIVRDRMAPFLPSTTGGLEQHSRSSIQ